MAKKLVRLFADTVAISKHGKVLRRLVEIISTPGLVYSKHQDYVGDPYYYSCDGIGESTATDIVIADAVFDAPVTKISEGAFGYLQNIKSVQIPDTVTSIGTGAFAGCKSLTTIHFPKGLTVLEPLLFQGCTSISSIEIPAGVTKISNQVFERCSYLHYVKIPTSVTYIGANAFSNNTASFGIFYAGTESQWNAITKDPVWNGTNYNVTIQYNWSADVPTLPGIMQVDEPVEVDE